MRTPLYINGTVLLALGDAARSAASLLHPGRVLDADGDLITIKGKHLIHISSFNIIH